MGGVIAGLNLLARLVAESASETDRRRSRKPEFDLEGLAAGYLPKDFAGALRRPGLAVVAEMKQCTPSMGVLQEDYQPDQLAVLYSRGGAAALSVLTQEASFGGSLDHVSIARASSGLPILRKDFITDPYQVLETRAAGADALLLIVAALSVSQLAELLAATRERGLAALVEVHDEHEAEVAAKAGATIVGVNHRDLNTFEIDRGLTERLRPRLPPGVTLVAESGIRGAADARRMREAGASAILVGELLMRSPDPAVTISELTGA
jgi:indole-3-glycerol phosphate synthase